MGESTAALLCAVLLPVRAWGYSPLGSVSPVIHVGDGRVIQRRGTSLPSCSAGTDRSDNGEGENRSEFIRGLTVAFGSAVATAFSPGVGRAIDLGGMEFGFEKAGNFDVSPEDNPDGLRSPRPNAYRVDYTDPPTSVPFPKDLEPRIIDDLSKQQVVFFGGHGDSLVDNKLAASLMKRVASKLRNKVAIGIEQVERKFQPALDGYIAEGANTRTKKPSGGVEQGLEEADAALKLATQWEERSPYSFEAYLPIFHLARQQGIPLLALGVDSESASQVLRQGLEALDADDRNRYVSDFKGFIGTARDIGFQVYADQLIFSAYDQLVEEGKLGDKPPSRPNFFSARILGDEGVASGVVDYVTEKYTPVLVLQREDHVKFGFGASARAERIGESLGTKVSSKTVLLNPTAKDSLSGTTALRLALQLADDLYSGKPLANYFWFSKSPKVNLIPRMVNPEDKSWFEKINLYDFKSPPVT
ncbi:unnamed protein product [Discosporangium mesarthrocarpum]